MGATLSSRRAASALPPVGAGRSWAVLAVLCVSLLVVSLDNTVLNVALPTLVRDLRATDTQLQWIVDAYAIVFAGFLLVAGSLGDRLGRKWIYMAGLIVFAAGSAFSAFSGSPDRLIGARAFMGIGSAAIMPSTLSILTNVFIDENRRARAISIWSGTTGLGVAIGPIVGGWLLAHYWWGSVFLINVPIVAAGLLATIVLVPNSRDPHPRRADPLGALGSLTGLSLLLWGIIEAPDRSWGSPLVIAALLGALAVLVAFASWQARTDHPMLPLRLFQSRRFSGAIASMMLVLVALMGALFVLTQYLQFSLGYSALQTGLRIGPIALVILVLAPLSALLVRVFGTKAIVFVGMALISVGMLLLSHTSVAGTYLEALPAFLLIGAGVGLSFAPATESVMGSLPRNDAGIGAATNSAALQVGGALGVAILGSALATRYQDRLGAALSGQPVPPPVRHVILGSLGGALGVANQVGGALGAELAHLAQAAFVSGLDLAALAGGVIVAAGALVVLAVLPSRPPSQERTSGRSEVLEEEPAGAARERRWR
jgi:EmrB/QacA subfamily drug resistance transporter